MSFYIDGYSFSNRSCDYILPRGVRLTSEQINPIFDGRADNNQDQPSRTDFGIFLDNFEQLWPDQQRPELSEVNFQRFGNCREYIESLTGEAGIPSEGGSWHFSFSATLPEQQLALEQLTPEILENQNSYLKSVYQFIFAQPSSEYREVQQTAIRGTENFNLEQALHILNFVVYNEHSEDDLRTEALQIAGNRISHFLESANETERNDFFASLNRLQHNIISYGYLSSAFRQIALEVLPLLSNIEAATLFINYGYDRGIEHNWEFLTELFTNLSDDEKLRVINLLADQTSNGYLSESKIRALAIMMESSSDPAVFQRGMGIFESLNSSDRTIIARKMLSSRNVSYEQHQAIIETDALEYDPSILAESFSSSLAETNQIRLGRRIMGSSASFDRIFEYGSERALRRILEIAVQNENEPNTWRVFSAALNSSRFAEEFHPVAMQNFLSCLTRITTFMHSELSFWAKNWERSLHQEQTSDAHDEFQLMIFGNRSSIFRSSDISPEQQNDFYNLLKTESTSLFPNHLYALLSPHATVRQRAINDINEILDRNNETEVDQLITFFHLQLLSVSKTDSSDSLQAIAAVIETDPDHFINSYSSTPDLIRTIEIASLSPSNRITELLEEIAWNSPPSAVRQYVLRILADRVEY